MTNKEAIVIFETILCMSQNEASMDACKLAIEALKNTRPHGKWIKTNDYVTCAYGCIDYVKCSCCKNDSLEEGDYCPNCGADMRGDQDDSNKSR